MLEKSQNVKPFAADHAADATSGRPGMRSYGTTFCLRMASMITAT
jgi:hypothetical protein